MSQDDEDKGDDRTRVVSGAPPGAGMQRDVDDGATLIASGAGAGADPDAASILGLSLGAVTGSKSSGAKANAGANDAGVLPPGSRLAEFEITSLVGQGGFGAVYEAWDHTLERVVAIKEYLPVSLSTRQGDGAVVPLSERQRETFELGMRSFINEAKLLAQFDHPSLLKVYRFWEERGTTYMVMPFYRGDTLRQALSTLKVTPGGVREDWLLHIMDGVTQALAVMHAARCYHRDIAPDNIILLEGSGRPVVLDFGAARRVITDKTQAITVILKPGYAPVEQYAEMPDMAQGAWTDVYALAAVMHVAVAGRAPPPSVARLLADSYVPLAGDAQLRERYSQRLLQTIDAGLGVRPEARPQSMAELRVMLGLDGPAAQSPDATVILPKSGATHQTHQGNQGAGGHASSASSRRGVDTGFGGVETLGTPTGSGSSEGSGIGKGKLAGAVVAVLLVAGGGAWWWMQQGKGDASPEVVAGATGTGASGTGASVAKPSTGPATPPASGTSGSATSQLGAPPPAEPPRPPPPPPPPPRARTPAESLQALDDGATAAIGVKAAPQKAEVRTGKDALAFEVRSNREGFVYVFLLSSGGELFLLFPNLLDKYNKVKAGEALSLPRASWPMNAGGPAGTNRFAVMVSEHERDFADSGLQNDGVFPQFSLPVLAALEAARGNKGTPLAGKPQCPAGGPCKDVYGVSHFNIVEK